MKNLAAKCVQGYNEAEKRKALGRPGIDPRMAAKKKKPVVAEPEASRQEEPRIVFPTSMTGSKPKVPTVASEFKKTRAAEAKARKCNTKATTDDAPQPRKGKHRRETGLLPQIPFLSSQFLLLVLRLNIMNVVW